MAEEVGAILIEQTTTIDAIKRVIINFKKLAKNQITLAKVRNRKENLEANWNECCQRHAKLLLHATSTEKTNLPYFKDEVFLSAEDLYFEAADYLSDVIANLSGGNLPPSDASNLSILHDSAIAGSSQLPRLTLPKFSGDFTQWGKFRGLFESLVDSCKSLSNIQKLHYLKTNVTGDAALLIENISMSDENYQSAWKLLIDEYENETALIHSHLHKFVSLPSMKTESAGELKRLRDTVSSSLTALRNLNRPVDHWDDLLVYLISQKFSKRTRDEWNVQRGSSNKYSTYKEIHEFMTLRIRGLTDYLALSDSNTSKTKTASDSSKTRSAVNNVSVIKCIDCSGDHALFKCDRFKSKTLDQRVALVKENRLCFNCLRAGHASPDCKNAGRCIHCKRTHHSLLHRNPTSQNKVNNEFAVNNCIDQASSSQETCMELSASVQTVLPKEAAPSSPLLATAWVVLRTAEGRTFKLRALLDQGSTFSFITESVCQLMHTQRCRTRLQVQCFGEQYGGQSKSRVFLQLESCHDSKVSFPLTAYVYQSITSYAGSRSRFDLKSWPHLQDLPLADPNPMSSHRIHVLIGADLYGSLLLNDIRKGPFGTPTAQLTALGWILSGPTGRCDSLQESGIASNCTSVEDIDRLLQRFWEIDEIPSRSTLTPENEKCEIFFRESHTRTSDGRYVVRLPFKSRPPFDLNGSREIAFRYYSKLEQRLLKQPTLESEYRQFLFEYLSMGHMELVEEVQNDLPSVYIPHHPVVRPSSSTTKLRVVFNASARTKSGRSLNDYLMTGPKLQLDLSAIILRWRLFCYVYTADIAKMFRQIRIHPADADYQRIVWRPRPNLPIQTYRLLTVTYGLASAPYLALKVLHQLANDEGRDLPAAKSVLLDSVYVDDAIFGADDIQTLRNTREQLVTLTNRGGFKLHKWASNVEELLSDIPDDARELTPDRLLGNDETLKVLGISWIPAEDAFRFRIDIRLPEKCTKRLILSVVSKIFDPLGWASPVIIVAKTMIQELWLLKKDWDEETPPDFAKRWHEYCAQLPRLSETKIPRWTGSRNDDLAVELHGFADASNRAYAAVVYLRILHSLSEIQVTLLTAKTKVAPLKTVSIPRLELNAVVLLARLFEWTVYSLKLQSIRVYGWTDSTVVLAWLRQHPSTWNSYVANRVSEVQTRLPNIKWSHVKSKDNLADCASRGIPASELASLKVWWTGPSWLSRPSAFWPDQTISEADGRNVRDTVLSESKRATTLHISSTPEWELPSQYSSWTRLLRVTAYILKFVRNTRKGSNLPSSESRSLTAVEISEASHFWFTHVQKIHFFAELKSLKNNSSLAKTSSLVSLHPFIGRDSLIRLGGRLAHSALDFEEKHPIILPKHRIAELLIDSVHKQTLHGGVQLTLRVLRQRYWIISARSLIRAYIHRCITCSRHRAQSASQLMGALPECRVKPSSPFTHTGLDYAGPMHLLPVAGRGQKTRKYYIAIFVCLASKAVHLELVENYATSGFMAALKRFVSRRGLPSNLYSDNGTNFRGADHELQRTIRSVNEDPKLKDFLANDQITWHFIPPTAPHFGGLWEAGVKSVKYHLNRVVGAHTLSQSEFSTILCQIEACLNSRPISALTDEPTDLTALTPGHFLIGRPIVAIPEESVLDVNPNRLDRWQHVRRITEQIWRSWSADYLHTLHQRRKWQVNCANLQINELVLLKTTLLPPSKWLLGRIVRLHPGTDGKVRVVTVRTVNGEIKRPITQICPLPIPVSDGDSATK